MKILHITLLIFSSLRISSQSWDWVKTFCTSTSAVEKGEKIGADNAGNIYIKGSQTTYTGSGGSSNHISLLFKYNSSGILLWADTLLYDGRASIDRFGNTYIAAGSNIVKYNSTGQLAWVKLFNNRNFTYVETAFNGNIVVGGSTKGTFCTDSSAYCMLDPAGNIVWSRIGDFLSQCGTLPFACDKFSNCYLFGTKTINGFYFRTVQKVDTSGSITGSFSVNQFTANTGDYKIDIADDQSIRLGEVAFANTAGNSTNTITIINLTNSGSLLWNNTITAKQGALFDIKHDSASNLYLMMGYRTNLQYQNTVLTNSVALALIKTDANGLILRIKETNGNYYGNISAADMLINSNNKVYMTGEIQSFHNFDNYLINGDASYPDMFLCKLSEASIITNEPVIKKNEPAVNVYPSITTGVVKIDVAGIENNRLTISIANSSGQVVHREMNKTSDGKFIKSFDFGNLSKGLYLIKVTTDNGQTTKKIILE